MLKTAPDSVDPDPKAVPELPISLIRGICRGINTDVPNDAEPDAEGTPCPVPWLPPLTSAAARHISEI